MTKKSHRRCMCQCCREARKKRLVNPDAFGLGILMFNELMKRIEPSLAEAAQKKLDSEGGFLVENDFIQ